MSFVAGGENGDAFLCAATNLPARYSGLRNGAVVFHSKESSLVPSGVCLVEHPQHRSLVAVAATSNSCLRFAFDESSSQLRTADGARCVVADWLGYVVLEPVHEGTCTPLRLFRYEFKQTFSWLLFFVVLAVPVVLILYRRVRGRGHGDSSDY